MFLVEESRRVVVSCIVPCVCGEQPVGLGSMAGDYQSQYPHVYFFSASQLEFSWLFHRYTLIY